MAAISDFEIKNLRKALEESQSTIDSMLQQLAEMAETKKQLAVDIRSEQFSNMKLQQQLEDERNLYLIDKKHLCQEIESLKAQLGFKSSEGNQFTKRQIIEHNKIVCDLCIKFLRMKKTKQILKENFINSQRDMEHQISKLNSRIEELSYALSVTEVVGQFSKPYVRAVRRYLELQHDNRYLQRQVNTLKRKCYGLSDECTLPKNTKHKGSMTELSGCNKLKTKSVDFKEPDRSRKEKKKKRSKTISSKPLRPAMDASTSESTILLQRNFNTENKLMSFADCDISAYRSDSVAQLPVTECTSTSYFKLTRFTSTHTVNSGDSETVIQKGHVRGAMRTHSAPDIVKGKDFEGLNHQFTCYMKDIGTNT